MRSVGERPPVILNLGSGARTSASCVNIDWSPYIRIKQNPVLRRLAPLVLSGERAQRYFALKGELLAHNLRKGIPWPDDSVDAVYLSHVLEHIDRDQASGFLSEILRVLKPGGICRIVVPDLATICRSYLSDYELCLAGRAPVGEHERFVESLLEQSVRRESSGTKGLPRLRRILEQVLVGDARRRGETHQWMYDAVSLSNLMSIVGFTTVNLTDFQTSRVPTWDAIRLDQESDAEYKADSLYIEGAKIQ